VVIAAKTIDRIIFFDFMPILLSSLAGFLRKPALSLGDNTPPLTYNIVIFFYISILNGARKTAIARAGKAMERRQNEDGHRLTQA
jgi:hypothetical protein